MLQGVSAWNFDVAALKEQAQREGGLEGMLPTISESMDLPGTAPVPNGLAEPPAGALKCPPCDCLSWHAAVACTPPGSPAASGVLAWHSGGACQCMALFNLITPRGRPQQAAMHGWGVHSSDH